MILGSCRHITAALAWMVTAAAPGLCAADADVQVRVEVVDSDGAPIADAPVLVHSAADIDFGFTDAHGRLEVTTTLAKNSREVVAQMWNGAHLNLPWAQHEHALRREAQLTREYFMSPHTAAVVPETQTIQTLRMVLATATTLRGRFVDAKGVPLLDWAVAVRGGANGASSFPNSVEGPFALGGVKLACATELWGNTDSSQVHVYPLTAAQTRPNTDLGDIVLSDVESPVESDIQITNFAGLYGPGQVQWYDNVTLVRADGQAIYQFEIGGDGRVVERATADPADSVRGRLAPGRYFVVPGVFGSELHWALLDAVREGRHAELSNAGIPTITATEGAVATANIDLRAARDAFLLVSAR